MRTKPVLGAFGLLTFCLLLGCGGDRRASVTGKVTIAGKGPLPGGSIQFISVENPARMSGGVIKHDGSYEVPDAPVGDCKVVIDNSHLDPNAGKGSGQPGAAGGPGAGGMGKGMKGMPNAGAPPVASGAKAADKAKMGDAPKGADVPAEMNEGKEELADRKFVRLEGNFSKADSTPLTAKVSKDGDTFNFEVK